MAGGAQRKINLSFNWEIPDFFFKPRKVSARFGFLGNRSDH